MRVHANSRRYSYFIKGRCAKILTKIQYIDQSDRQAKIDANKGKFLIEEQNITEGNFLIFSDLKPLENQVQESLENQLTTMDVLATFYDEMSAKGTI